MVASDLVGTWRTFVGHASLLNQLPIVRNIYTTDIALSYDRIVRDFLADRARSRSESTMGESYFTISPD